MRVHARVESTGELQPRRHFVRCLVAKQPFADRVARVIGRRLREEEPRVFEKPALRKVLCRRPGGEEEKRELHCSRRSPCTVKSSSFSGTLYWSFSMRSTVRLLRRRSLISSTRA